MVCLLAWNAIAFQNVRSKTCPWSVATREKRAAKLHLAVNVQQQPLILWTMNFGILFSSRAHFQYN